MTRLDIQPLFGHRRGNQERDVPCPKVVDNLLLVPGLHVLVGMSDERAADQEAEGGQLQHKAREDLHKKTRARHGSGSKL